jgi:hypothetical protein
MIDMWMTAWKFLLCQSFGVPAREEKSSGSKNTVAAASVPKVVMPAEIKMVRRMRDWRGCACRVPTPNPNYDRRIAELHREPVGCSRDSSVACVED